MANAPLILGHSAAARNRHPFGVRGLILLLAFVALLLTGWRFGLEVQAPS